MQAIILCGGKGTRLSALYSDRPKVLVPIAGKPFLAWQLEWLARGGVTDIHLAAGYKAEKLEEWAEERTRKSEVGSQRSGVRGQGSEDDEGLAATPTSFRIPHSTFDIHLTLSVEPAPLGTGGGLKFVEPFVRSDPFLVINGDTLVPAMDFAALVPVLAAQPTAAGLIAVTRIQEAGRYGTVEFDADGIITAFREKVSRTDGWINAGVYLLRRTFLDNLAANVPLSIETDCFPTLVRERRLLAAASAPPLLDMGTPDGITAMESYLKTVAPNP